MPYVVEVDNNISNLKMPKLCPYCLNKEANSSIDIKYTKSLGGIPTPAIVLFLYQERMFRFPACSRCAKTVSVLSRVAPLIAIIPLVVFMGKRGRIYFLQSSMTLMSAPGTTRKVKALGSQYTHNSSSIKYWVPMKSVGGCLAIAGINWELSALDH